MRTPHSLRSGIIIFAAFTAFFGAPVFATSTVAPVTPGGGSIPDFSFQIPIKSLSLSGADITSGAAIAQYIGAIYQWLVGFAAVAAVLAFTYGGVLWLIAGGESSKVTESKKVMTNAVAGLLLAIGSYVFLATISPNLVTFKPITVASINPLDLKLAALAAVPSTSSILTRASTTTRTSLPTSVGRPTFTASCQLECQNKGTARGRELEAVVTESGGSFECNCKEKTTSAICTEPDTEISRQASCSDICPIGSTIPPNLTVLKVKNNFPHTDSAGAPFYCCSCIVANGTNCGSRKDQMCCGIPDGDVICKGGLYPVKKSTFANENKCQCEEGKEGSICNFATGQGCGPGLKCKRSGLCAFGSCLSIGGSPEDGECKR